MGGCFGFYIGNTCSLCSGIEYIRLVDVTVSIWVDVLVFTVLTPVVCPVGWSTLARWISMCLYGSMSWFLQWEHL